MSRPTGLSAWTEMVSTNFPALTKPQATVLALWSFGIALTRCCGRMTVATFLALLLDQHVATVEQRLYEWCLDAPAKAGRQRTALDVSTCFGPLVSWIVRLWHGSQLAVALDATTLSDHFVLLVVSVVYRGGAIPIAQRVLPAGQRGTWRAEWLRLLRQIRRAIPHDWTVVVLADRGLQAPWLFRRIVRLGWHPLLRINQAAKFRPAGQAKWLWLRALVGHEGQRWRGAGTAFVTKNSQLACTLVAWWAAGHAEPWFILTDLPPDGCDAQWYALRGWCEQGFKCINRGGWQWQQTQMHDPARVARLWLALAVASLWMISVGSDLEVGPPDEQEPDEQEDMPDVRALLDLLPGTPHPRRLRLFRLGWLWLLVQALRGHDLPLPQRFLPEPWPDVPLRLDHAIPRSTQRLAYAYM